VVRIGVEAPEELPILREELTDGGKLPATTADMPASPDTASRL
jgi:sRNA-binding carbon storage regulator CsrA